MDPMLPQQDSSSRPSSYARDKTDDLCEECGMWPKVLTAEGFRHPFCSKTCAKKYRHAITTVTPPSPTQDLCLGCGLRPKSTADGYQYPHCSRSCARQWPLLAQDCALPGCKVPITGAFGGYCSTAHSDQARRPNVLHKPRQPVAGPSSAQPHRLLAPVELRHYSRSAPTSPVNRILFYDKNARYYGFTNFSYHPVTYRGNTYPTSEHLFQSFKVCVSRSVDLVF
ncbi:hypothetical protein D9615_004957 [Tricholomella constricta]|uniref:Uncharacterized protein n=1 Tax=Tricholomella constricta TaxID=117010 RepID=A0A8H5HHA8_9AGAR|nr:hypothetical protein D9615_004957 [Tricholomella constricta]